MCLRRGACWLLPLLLLGGCGTRDRPLVPIAGQVFLQGRPLEGGLIVFSPDPERGGNGPVAWATIGADGRYHLESDGATGVSAGWHRIAVAGKVVKLHGRYADPELSGLSFEVNLRRVNVCNVQLE